MNEATTDRRAAYPAPDIDDEIDLGELIGVLIENRWLILAVTAVFFLLGLTYAFVATPIYKADGLIQVEEKKSGLGDLDINALFEGDASVTAEIEILRSRMVLGAVVDNLKLDIVAEPNYFPIVGKAMSRRGTPSERQHIRVDTLDVPDALIGEPLSLVAGSGSSYELLDSDGE